MILWKIWRPQLWLLDRRVRSTNRLLVITLLLLVTVGGSWAYQSLVRPNLDLFRSEEIVVLAATFLPFMLMILMLFSLLGVDDVIRQLYFSAQLEQLMIAPVPYPIVFVTRLLSAGRTALIPAGVSGAFFLVLGVARDAPAAYFILVGLLLLAGVLLVSSLLLILVLLSARLLPPEKARSWMPVALSGALVVFALGQGPLNRWFLSQEELILYLVEALIQPEKLAIVAGTVGGLALLVAGVAALLFDRAFHEGWNRLRLVPAAGSRFGSRRFKLNWVVRRLPAPMRYIVVKEWLVLRRTPNLLLGLISPLIFVLLILLPLAKLRNSDSGLLDFFFWLILFSFSFLLVTLPTGTPLLLLLEEGPNLALLRLSPASPSAFLGGKLLANWLLLAMVWLLLPAITVWLGMDLWQLLFLLATVLWALGGVLSLTLGMAAVAADFSAVDVKQRLSWLTNLLMILLNSIFVLLVLTMTVTLTIGLFPEHPTVEALRALEGFRLVGWLFDSSSWLPFALAAGQLLFWLGIGWLWRTAVRRLSGWEPG